MPPTMSPIIGMPRMSSEAGNSFFTTVPPPRNPMLFWIMPTGAKESSKTTPSMASLV